MQTNEKLKLISLVSQYCPQPLTWKQLKRKREILKLWQSRRPTYNILERGFFVITPKYIQKVTFYKQFVVLTPSN